MTTTDPISALFAKQSSVCLATSALPQAPVVRNAPRRRRQFVLRSGEKR